MTTNSSNINDSGEAKIRPSILSGKVSKSKIVFNEQGVPASVSGPVEMNAADRDAAFDAAVSTTRGLKLSDASVNHTIKGNKIYDTNSGELVGEFGKSDLVLTPSIRNSAFKGSGRVGSPSISKLEPSHAVGEHTSFIPAAERVAEPASPVAPGSDIDQRLSAIEQALAALLEAKS